MKYFFAILLLVSACTGFSQNLIQPIAEVNQIIGDESFVETFGYLPDKETDNRLRIITHLKYVEDILRKKEVNGLSDELKQNRLQMLDWLKEYIQRGQFPLNEVYSDRVPCFIDNYGTICAVGYLVEKSNGREFAENINNKYQYYYISDMQDDELMAWIDKSGLTSTEIAMIQPTYLSLSKAYTIYIGPQIGLNYSGIRQRDFISDHNRRIGARMGVQIDKRWGNGFAIGSELLMQHKGYTHDIVFTDETGAATGETAEMKFRASYLSLPLKCGVYIGRAQGAFINIGAVPSLLLSSTLETPEIAIDGASVIPAENIEMDDKLNKFDLSAMAELGYFIKWQVFQFDFKLLFDQSLTRFNNEDYFPDAKVWHNSFSAAVSLKYMLKNKF